MAAHSIQISTTTRSIVSAPAGELCNLLQIAASTLHLLDRQIDDELRPLISVGLAALRQAAGAVTASPSQRSTIHLNRSISQ